MKALRLHGFKDLRLEDVPEPACRPGTVKIRPLFNGICGSDVHGFFIDGMRQIFLGEPHPLTGESPPVVFGHEFAGVIVETGEGVHLQVGEEVAVMPIHADGTCDACERGAPNCCRNLGFIGLHGGGGGLSEAVVVKATNVFKLPQGLGCEVGALVEPLAVGWHGVRLASGIGPESKALVIGGGPVGCAILLALKARGVEDVFVSELSTSRSEICRKLGAKKILDAPATDAVMHETGGRGADVVFICAGVPQALEVACASVRTHGQIVNMAIWPGPITLDIDSILFKEASLRASIAYVSTDFQEVIDALANGSMDPRAMITARIPIEKTVEEGLYPLHSTSGTHCKILIDLSM